MRIDYERLVRDSEGVLGEAQERMGLERPFPAPEVRPSRVPQLIPVQKRAADRVIGAFRPWW
jgi:hypothetical protein